MIKRTKASISKCIIHKVGNKFNSTKNTFSEQPIDFDEASYDLILPYLLRPFVSVAESFRFNHHSNLDLNEINSYATQLLNDDTDFVDISKHIVTHLFEQSNSAQIKTGDVIVCMFHDIQYEDYVTDAIGIFKVENKTNFFQTYLENRNIIYVSEWNSRVLQPQRFNPNLYEMQIDYRQGIDYGYEVNYKLYNYFIYFQLKYKQQLAGRVPRI